MSSTISLRRRHVFVWAIAVALSFTVLTLSSAQALGPNAIRSGFDSNTLAANDDGSTAAVPIGFTINFFGADHSSLFVNNNGNVTFDAALETFTPFNLDSLVKTRFEEVPAI